MGGRTFVRLILCIDFYEVIILKLDRMNGMKRTHYCATLTKENVDDITENLKKKLEQSRPSVKAQLQDIRKEQQSQHQYSHRKKDGPEI